MRKVWIASIVIASVITGTAAISASTIPFSGTRPYQLFVPSNYNPSTPEPLIIGLSGYNQTGSQFEKYLKLAPLAQTVGFLYLAPDGSKDSHGIRFWNGTPECCDFQSPRIDDDAYILKIINEVSARYSVDQNRIYIVGHSNGGFLANHIACKNADRIAAIVNFAGGSYTSTSACRPSNPISVLEIWGTNDETYLGNHILGRPIPGAVKIFYNWGSINHCSLSPTTQSQRDSLLSSSKKPDTTVMRFHECPASTAIDFWNIKGADHAPVLTDNFRRQIVQWLFTHPKVSTN